MLKRHARLLGLLAIALLIVLTAGLWWHLPAMPRTSWHSLHQLAADVVVSADGRTLLTQDEHGVCLWDIPAGHERSRLPVGVPGPIFALLSPDGRKSAYLGYPFRTAYLWCPDLH